MLTCSSVLLRGWLAIMLRALLVVLASVLMLGAMGDLRLPAFAGADRRAITAACEYYDLRAERQPTHQSATFVEFLADTCGLALNSLGSDNQEERQAAKLLLMRIVLLHQTVTDMNAAREAAVADKTGAERMRALSRVTQSGEFLIAHRMGVMHAFDAWLDSGADFSLASYR